MFYLEFTAEAKKNTKNLNNTINKETTKLIQNQFQ